MLGQQNYVWIICTVGYSYLCMPWQSPQTFPILRTNQVHIWRAPLKRNKEELAQLSALLNSQEKARADKFIAEHAKNNFTTARGILRYLLAKYLQTNPQDLTFQQNQHGKLHLESSELQFNISHSRDWALFIFAMNQPVGVDIEFIRNDFDFAPIAQRFFSKKENMELLALPQDQQLRAFFNCWSRKEAFIKALGKGLFCALDGFSVEVSSKKEGKLQLHVADIEFDTKNWSLEALNPVEGYVGAFTTSLSEYKACLYDFC
ncbi:MAG: 4'-phosphopantetheinyl transferase [uncultured bacterium]|nr:MAG: 4'-phosphopantetheinyl transferase [uncultured bacterium]